MYLSKPAYYADLIVLPMMMALLGLSWLGRGGWQQALIAVSCILGIALYTLLEYFWHRYAQHHIPAVQRMHERHHGHPGALVGTPAWITAAACMAPLLLFWWPFGWNFASGIAFGLMLGCLWYSAYHHALHHWPARRGTWLYRLKRRHYMHHHALLACNFGVTTSMWDRMFGSERRRNPYAA